MSKISPQNGIANPRLVQKRIVTNSNLELKKGFKCLILCENPPLKPRGICAWLCPDRFTTRISDFVWPGSKICPCMTTCWEPLLVLSPAIGSIQVSSKKCVVNKLVFSGGELVPPSLEPRDGDGVGSRAFFRVLQAAVGSGGYPYTSRLKLSRKTSCVLV